MNENNENIVKIDIPSFQDMCKRIIELEKENKQLKADNQILGNELTYFKEYSADLEETINKKETLIEGLKTNLQVTTIERNNYCEKVTALSKEIQDIKLCNPVTPADIAEENFIANGEKMYALFEGDDY